MDTTSDYFELRAPCPGCQTTDGYSLDKGGQDVAYCAACNRYQYCRPKTESGRERRTVRTRPAIKPSQRFKLLEQFAHTCVSCGANDRLLHIAHIISVEAYDRFGAQVGMTEDELWADENLCVLCEECNLGMAGNIASVSLTLKAQRMRRLINK